MNSIFNKTTADPLLPGSCTSSATSGAWIRFVAHSWNSHSYLAETADSDEEFRTTFSWIALGRQIMKFWPKATSQSSCKISLHPVTHGCCLEIPGVLIFKPELPGGLPAVTSDKPDRDQLCPQQSLHPLWAAATLSGLAFQKDLVWGHQRSSSRRREIEDQIPGGIATNHKTKSIKGSSPEPLDQISIQALNLFHSVVKQRRETVRSHLCGLICIHLIEIMGLNRAALENLRIDHIAFTHISDKRAKSSEILTVAQQILLGVADKPFRSLRSAKRRHCEHELSSQTWNQCNDGNSSADHHCPAAKPRSSDWGNGRRLIEPGKQFEGRKRHWATPLNDHGLKNDAGAQNEDVVAKSSYSLDTTLKTCDRWYRYRRHRRNRFNQYFCNITRKGSNICWFNQHWIQQAPERQS